MSLVTIRFARRKRVWNKHTQSYEIKKASCYLCNRVFELGERAIRTANRYYCPKCYESLFVSSSEGEGMTDEEVKDFFKIVE